jgi:uncharacterized protein YerC
MRISKEKVNPSLEREVSRLLYQTMADLKTPKATETFLRDILSPQELTAVVKRLAVAYWLAKGRSYENIRQNLKVSSATIASIDRMRKKGKSIQEAIRAIDADAWAEQWAGRIRGVLNKK